MGDVMHERHYHVRVLARVPLCFSMSSPETAHLASQLSLTCWDQAYAKDIVLW